MGIFPKFETPYERGGVLVPGLRVLPDDVERYPVAALGSLVLEVDEGDEISVLDLEGLQPAELVLFDRDGKSRAGMLGDASAGVLDENLSKAALAALNIPRDTARSFAMGFTWKASTQQFLENLALDSNLPRQTNDDMPEANASDSTPAATM